MTGEGKGKGVDRYSEVRKLWLDRLAVAVVSQLRSAGVRAVLLKGVTLERLLYDAGEHRPYGDVDLLVAECELPVAEVTLAALGFSRRIEDSDFPGHEPLHGLPWTRGSSDLATVDLHTTLPGVAVARPTAWRVLCDETAQINLDGAWVEVLTPAARALHVALHAAHHGTAAELPMQDLGRALARLPPEAWPHAARLAERLGAVEGFAAGLRLLREGEDLAQRLALPRNQSIDQALKAGSGPRLAAGLLRLRQVSGPRAKAKLVATVLVPTPAWVRWWSPLARRGRVGLFLSYLAFPFWVLLRLPGALVALMRAWHAARS
ncbi:MAG: nucleotidyltransferase family protein [Solirubrobacteraceae bacterium]